MRICDDRYNRDHLRLDTALRFIQHEARTHTDRESGRREKHPRSWLAYVLLGPYEVEARPLPRTMRRD